jgi:ELWxxDGT repeat protein
MQTNLGRVVLVQDINPGNSGSFAGDFILLDDRLFFTANNGVNGEELWVTDGTSVGTKLVRDITPGSGERFPFSSYIKNSTVLNNKLYFSADDRVNGQELWVSDGTAAGTQLLKDINLGNNSNPSGLISFNNKLYFSAIDRVNEISLWVSDGTTAGTQLLKNIDPNFTGSFNFTEFNGKLYFSAFDATSGVELWVTNGTNSGTQLVKDINFNSNSNSDYGPSGFTIFNNKLYFIADDGVNGNELWTTDGTNAGTQLVKDINFGIDDSGAGSFTLLNNKLYFIADDGVNGRELWVTDGTNAGTQLVKDIRPGIYTNYSYNLTQFNDKLYFTANDGVNGTELWVSDGTTAGTQLLKDINPAGNEVYEPDYGVYFFTEFNNKLYFSADDGVNGRELWVTDGTTAGTQLVIDLNPGSNNSNPANLTVVGTELFFTANNGTTGFELFKLTLTGSTTITGTNNSDNLNGTINADRIDGLNGNDILNGNADNDTLTGSNGNDSLVGAAGNDSLLGGNGSDSLNGGNGNDILDGGVGFDLLNGGAGNDVFVVRLANGGDSIVDFRLGSDRIGLTGGLEFDDLTRYGNTIRSGNELLATLTGVNTANLTAANFLIHA